MTILHMCLMIYSWFKVYFNFREIERQEGKCGFLSSLLLMSRLQLHVVLTGVWVFSFIVRIPLNVSSEC